MKLNSNNILLFLVDSYLFPTLLGWDRIISPEEGKRASSFAFDSDRIQYLASHIALRIALSALLEKSPESLKFSSGKWGKPYLDETPFPCFFNLSRTKGSFAIAASHFPEIGVDIETSQISGSWQSIVKGYFSNEEQVHIQSLEQGERGFLECWTKREAFLKGTGEGIGGLDFWKQTSFLTNQFADPRTREMWCFYHCSSIEKAFVTLAYKQDENQKEVIHCDICSIL